MSMSEWSWQVAVETNLKNLAERKRVLEHDAEGLRNMIRVSFEQLRRAMDEQESRLLNGVEEVVASSRHKIDDQEANVTALRARLSEGADSMNRAVATGDINGVVLHGKRLEEASLNLREADAIIQSMDTNVGGTLPTEAAENAVKNLCLSGGHAPALGNNIGFVAPPAHYATSPIAPHYALHDSTPTAARPAVAMSSSTPATGETVPNAIYVNGVPHDASEADVREAFERFGEIKMVNARHINTGGFAFVFFKEDIGAQIAMENPRVLINGKTANVLAKKQILGGGR